MSVLDILIGTFIFLPIINLIHELGHVSSAKFFGAEIEQIVIVTGKTIFKKGCIEIRKIYFLNGYFISSKLGNGRTSKTITCLGGIILNTISCVIVYILCYINIIDKSVANVFIVYSLFCIITNLIPMQYRGYNSDGLQVYQIIKTGNSSFYKQ